MLHQRFSLSEARPPELVPSMNAFEDPLWSYNRNLWMHHLTGGAAYLPL